MIESLLSFEHVNKRPWLTALWAFLLANIALLISSQIAGSFTGVDFGFFGILFIIIPSVYFIITLIKREERIEENIIKYKQKGLWERHEKDILILLFYFIGLTVTFSIWSFALPEGAFSVQVSKISQIKGFTGAFSGAESFTTILINNIQVMLFSFFFSFLFGAGAVFIIEWNASILGVYIGQLSKSIWEVPIVTLAFLPHGIPEIAGYLAAGLAGGLLSAAITRKNSPKMLEIIILDSMKIIAIAFILLIIGAAIEVWL
jgi:uncharacterized membrane protein SpoIIM required for sporulation